VIEKFRFAIQISEEAAMEALRIQRDRLSGTHFIRRATATGRLPVCDDPLSGGAVRVSITSLIGRRRPVKVEEAWQALRERVRVAELLCSFGWITLRHMNLGDAHSFPCLNFFFDYALKESAAGWIRDNYDDPMVKLLRELLPYISRIDPGERPRGAFVCHGFTSFGDDVAMLASFGYMICARIAVARSGFKEHSLGPSWWIKAGPDKRSVAVNGQLRASERGWLLGPDQALDHTLAPFMPSSVARDEVVRRLVSMEGIPGCLWEPALRGKGLLVPACSKSNIYMAVSGSRISFCNATLEVTVEEGRAVLTTVPCDRLGRESRSLGKVGEHLGLPASALTGQAAACAALDGHTAFAQLVRDSLPALVPEGGAEGRKRMAYLHGPVLRTRQQAGLSGLLTSLSRRGLEVESFPVGQVPPEFVSILSTTPPSVVFGPNGEPEAPTEFTEGPWRSTLMKVTKIFDLLSGPTKGGLREPSRQEMEARERPHVLCLKRSTMSAAIDAMEEVLASREPEADMESVYSDR
jgi:hypothetical protein